MKKRIVFNGSEYVKKQSEEFAYHQEKDFPTKLPSQ